MCVSVSVGYLRALSQRFEGKCHAVSLCRPLQLATAESEPKHSSTEMLAKSEDRTAQSVKPTDKTRHGHFLWPAEKNVARKALSIQANEGGGVQDTYISLGQQDQCSEQHPTRALGRSEVLKHCLGGDIARLCIAIAADLGHQVAGSVRGEAGALGESVVL